MYSVSGLEDTPAEVFDRLVAVNLMGVVAGSREGDRSVPNAGRHGTLINVSSMIGGLAGPLRKRLCGAQVGRPKLVVRGG